MKLLLSLPVVPLLLLVGCGEKSSSSTPATNAPAAGSGSALTAPVDHLKAAVQEQQNMVKTVDVTALNKAVDMFQVQEGRLPKDLEELVAKKYIPTRPEPPVGYRLSYNQDTGKVTIEKQ